MPTLHYVFIYPECGLSLTKMIDDIQEAMPCEILEWKIAIQYNVYYIFLKFHLGITVPYLKHGFTTVFGSENIDQFQYCTISSIKKLIS